MSSRNLSTCGFRRLFPIRLCVCLFVCLFVSVVVLNACRYTYIYLYTEHPSPPKIPRVSHTTRWQLICVGGVSVRIRTIAAPSSDSARHTPTHGGNLCLRTIAAPSSGSGGSDCTGRRARRRAPPAPVLIIHGHCSVAVAVAVEVGYASNQPTHQPTHPVTPSSYCSPAPPPPTKICAGAPPCPLRPAWSGPPRSARPRGRGGPGARGGGV